MGDESSCKVYVSTAAEFSADGFLRPLWIIWEDGRRAGKRAASVCAIR